MRTSDFDFILPDELIAQFPAKNRTGSRLLRLDGNTGTTNDNLFEELCSFIHPGDLLIFNDTRVIKARLKGQKPTGGNIEVLIERIIDAQHALAHIKSSRSPKAGSVIHLAEGKVTAIVSGREDDLFLLEFDQDTDILEMLEQYGALPLPPYITHLAGQEDEERYQTVYAKNPGAVAAPTAGLHFDTMMLEKLAAHGVQTAYVTLHVGAGTFQPVRVEDISEHRMHSELYSVPVETVKLIKQTKARGNKVTAIGTTAMRALESAARSGELIAGSGDTDIFITPGYRFNVVERLLTNFHLPKSTLLMLVSAFAGLENIQNAYQHAIKERYRFFSYGDAMLIERKS